MSGLRSDLFRGDSALQAALTDDAGHVVKGARGPHVRKIQAAVTLLLSNPPSSIDEREISAGLYGDTTANAVLRYKTENNIINTAYETAADNITGKMTTRALDDAMVGVEAEFALNILRILARLDQLLAREDTDLPPDLRRRFISLKTAALLLMAPGGGLPSGRFEQDYQSGVDYMDAIARDFRSGGDLPITVAVARPPVVFAALPLAVGAGAAIAVFLIAIAAVIALILLAQLMIESRTLGNRVNQAIGEAVDAGEAAILENIRVVDNLDRAVEHCKRSSLTSTAACLAALAKFAAKRLDVVAKRNKLHSLLRSLKDALDGDPKKLVWKVLARLAESAGEALAQAEGELRDIVREIIRECGCAFIKI